MRLNGDVWARKFWNSRNHFERGKKVERTIEHRFICFRSDWVSKLKHKGISYLCKPIVSHQS